MEVNDLQRLIGHGEKENRIDKDFYQTPSHATESLLGRERFDGNIWEPACGSGAISNILLDRGYNVASSDIVNRGYGFCPVDFLTFTDGWARIGLVSNPDNIITNPPFSDGTDFALHALTLARKKVVLFGKLSFLEGKTRGKKLFSQRKLARVWVFSERVGFNKGDQVKGKGGGMLAFAWFVFDQEHNGPASLDWI